MKRAVVIGVAVVGIISAVMLRQTGRAQAEAELWAEATETATPRS